MGTTTARRSTRTAARGARLGGAFLLAISLTLPAVASLTPAALAAATPTLEVAPDAGLPGAELTARGRGFPAGVGVEIRWAAIGGAIVGDGKTDAAGSFAIPFPIPLTADPGLVRVFACVVSTAPCPVRAADVVTVIAPPTPAPTTTPTPPRPTPTPVIVAPTPAPTIGPVVTPAPTPSGGTIVTPPTPTPAPTLPVPTFPLTGPSPTPSPFSVAAITPAPTPPSGLAASPGPFPDLDIIAIEVTQGIQNLSNSMPLVADRRTYARVYLDVIGASELAHTYGALEARRNGQQIGWMWPENGPITAVANGGNRLDLDDSLYFRLPNSWLDGTVQLTAFAYSHGVDVPWTHEPSAANNFEQVSVTFHQAEPLELHLATIHLHRSFHPTDVIRDYDPDLGGGAGAFATAGGSDTARVLAGLRRYHPIASLSWDLFPVTIEPLEHDTPDEWDLGDCWTTVVEPEPGSGGLWLADWEPFMKEPDDADFVVDQYVAPDRTKMWILDRTFEVSHFYVREGGRAQVFASSDSVGPAPVLGAPAFVDTCPNPNGESGGPNSTLALFRIFYDWAESREFFIGMVDPSLPTRWAGLASGLDTAWVNMNPNQSTGAPWYFTGASTMAHEVGHLAGLKHVACKDSDDDGVPDELIGGAVDPTHPQQDRFPDCSLAEVRDYGYYGFDVYHDLFGLAEPAVISNDPDAPFANRAFPLLGYQSNKWIDPYHYCRLLVYYGVPCDPDTIDEPWNPPGGGFPDSYWIPQEPIDVPLPQPEGPLLLVTGLLDPNGDGTTLEGVVALDEPTQATLEAFAAQDLVPESEIVARLVALDSDGGVVFDTPIGDDSSGEEKGGPFRYDRFVPLDPSIDRIEVRSDAGRPLTALPVSPSAPTARWTSLQAAPDGTLPEVNDEVLVTFESGDADGDDLTATLLYAPDREHWQVLTTGVADGSLPLAGLLDGLPGSETGTLRLLVTDGVHTTIASDEPQVRLPNAAPTASIETPTTALEVPLGANVVLAGSAWDAEDRQLPDEALAWSSSIDGPLGSGPEVRTHELAAGRHVLELTATDSAGATGVATVEIVVDGSRAQPRPDAALESAVGGIFDRLGSGGDPAPPAAELAHVVQQDESVTPLAAILGLGIAAVAVAAWALRMRMLPTNPGGGPTPGGDSSTWVRVAQPHGGESAGGASKDVTLKGSKIGQNAQPDGRDETITIHGPYDP